ncbi:MAG: histidine kinase [Nitrospirae bacterium]|nr:histidine kinase [Nitrospirota bacterium]
MDSIGNWFSNNLDMVFFIYGLAFFVMGMAIFILSKKESIFRIADIFGLLAVFGLVHGVNEWLEMWKIIKGGSYLLELLRVLCLITSFSFLCEFGRRLFIINTHEGSPAWRKKIARCPGWFFPVAVGFFILIFVLALHDFQGAGSIWTRYLIGFPGAFFTGTGFFSYYRREREVLREINAKRCFLTTGSVFCVYGVLSGLVVPRGDFFPSNLINADSFLAVTHIPVQLLRAVCAVVAALSVGKMLAIFDWETKRKGEEDKLEKHRLLLIAAEKQVIETQLRMLQAQMEPHFLFNTLANIISLTDINPGNAKRMLHHLAELLRVSLKRSREELSTLDEEADLLGNYLSIFRIRMGERLNFEIDITEDLRCVAFPPMLIQPLVENAVRHGIEPKVEGGSVTVKAILADSRLRLIVTDTGLGLPVQPNCDGTGLANVRARLQALYGDGACLVLEENNPCGIIATIEVPV